jgi:hypothetical protein
LVSNVDRSEREREKDPKLGTVEPCHLKEIGTSPWACEQSLTVGRNDREKEREREFLNFSKNPPI